MAGLWLYLCTQKAEELAYIKGYNVLTKEEYLMSNNAVHCYRLNIVK